MDTKETRVAEPLLKSLQEGKSLTQAFDLTASDIERIAGVAAGFYQEGKLKSALKLLEGLTALQPAKAEYWSALGAVLTRLEKHEEAIPVLTLAIKMDSQDTAALVNRGESYMALAKVEDACADFERAVAVDPAQKDVASNRARQLLYGFEEFFRQCHEEGLDSVDIEDEP